MQKKWIVWTMLISVVLVFLLGYLVLASGVGSKDDPLVTLSYLNGVLSPQTTQLINDTAQKSVSEKVKEMQSQFDSMSAQLDSKINEFKNQNLGLADDPAFIEKVSQALSSKLGDGITAGSPWQVVTVPKNKKVTCKVGTEIVLRIGNATCVASGTPGLINLSTGGDLANGGTLANSNLYLVTVDGRGFKAGSSDATVLISGSYTIE